MWGWLWLVTLLCDSIRIIVFLILLSYRHPGSVPSEIPSTTHLVKDILNSVVCLYSIDIC